MAAIASGLIRQKRQAREQQVHRPTPHRRRRSPNKNKGLCNGNLVDIFSKVRIFGLKKRRLRRQGVGLAESAGDAWTRYGCHYARGREQLYVSSNGSIVYPYMHS
uniref:Uncharacterized protein n=1 Tax=Salmo trutta TaxID=8032 RepID=A0A674B8C5_SALTR